MEKKLYSIYDKKLQRFNVPGFEEDDRTIMISLQRALKDHTQFLYINKDDLALYCLGVFNDKDGSVVPENTLVCDIASLNLED